MKRDKQKEYIWKLFNVIAYVLTAVGVIAVSVFHGFPLRAAIPGFVMAMAVTGMLMFVLNSEDQDGKIPMNGSLAPDRVFYPIFAIQILSFLSGFAPEFTIPFSAVVLLITYLSGFPTGIAAALMSATVSTVVLSESGPYFFLIIFNSLLLMFIMRNRLKVRKETSYMPLVVWIVISLVVYAAVIIFFNVTPKLQVILFPLFGLFIDLIVVLIFLPKLRLELVFKADDFYDEINDPEYVMLLKFKKEEKHEFQRAIHTAYLSDRIADQIGADRRKAKVTAYYHRIGVLTGDKDQIAENTLAMIKKDDFPLEIIESMEEYWGYEGHRMSRETAVVYVADHVIAAIYDEIHANPGVKPDYTAIISKTINSLLRTREIRDSWLTLYDIEKIEKRLLGEKLYYDFLH